MIDFFKQIFGCHCGGQNTTSDFPQAWVESLQLRANYIEDKCPAIQKNSTQNSIIFIAPNDDCKLLHFDRMMRKLAIQGQKACDFIFWSQTCSTRIFYEVKSSNQKCRAEKQLLESIRFILQRTPDAIDTSKRHYAVYSYHDNSQSRHEAVHAFSAPNKRINKPMKLENTDLDKLNFDLFAIFSPTPFDLANLS